MLHIKRIGLLLGGSGSSCGPAECEDATLAFQLAVRSGKVSVISRKGRGRVVQRVSLVAMGKLLSPI